MFEVNIRLGFGKLDNGFWFGSKQCILFKEVLIKFSKCFKSFYCRESSKKLSNVGPNIFGEDPH